MPWFWILGSSPRMTTEERKGTHASVPDAAPFKGSAAILLPSVILGLDPRIHLPSTLLHRRSDNLSNKKAGVSAGLSFST
jgi:hypothetical protein